MISNYRVLSLSILILSVISACSEPEDEDASPTVIDSFEIRVPRTFLNGIGSQLKAGAFHGQSDISDSVMWISSNPSIATVDGIGMLSAQEIGMFTVTAQLGNVSESLNMEVFHVSGEGTSSMDITFINLLKKYDIPGGVFAIAKRGKLLANRAYGLADRSGGVPMKPNSLFRVASVSKPITGVATMKLIADGRLNLDDKAFELLSEIINDVSIADERINDITVFHLLHHTAGWDRNIVSDPMFNQERIKTRLQIDEPPTATQVVQWLAGEPLQFDPGARFAYHNLTYVVLGRVIEAVTGKSYEQFINEEIFEPNGITSARVARTRFEDRLADEVVYDYRNKTGNSIFDPSIMVKEPYGGMGGAIESMDAHGGWVLSIPDLARFAVRADGNEVVPDILPNESFNQMIADPGFGYGAGWFLSADSHNHTGGIPGTAAVIWIDRSRQFIIVGALNGTPLFGTQENTDFFNEYVTAFIGVGSSFSNSGEDLFDRY